MDIERGVEQMQQAGVVWILNVLQVELPVAVGILPSTTQVYDRLMEDAVDIGPHLRADIVGKPGDLRDQRELAAQPERFELPDYEEIALVLQGGGALGSYQAAVYEGLSERTASNRPGSPVIRLARSIPRSLPATRLKIAWKP
jgi:hypothetical protein